MKILNLQVRLVLENRRLWVNLLNTVLLCRGKWLPGAATLGE
jgi:hypothetical protein